MTHTGLLRVLVWRPLISKVTLAGEKWTHLGIDDNGQVLVARLRQSGVPKKIARLVEPLPAANTGTVGFTPTESNGSACLGTATLTLDADTAPLDAALERAERRVRAAVSIGRRQLEALHQEIDAATEKLDRPKTRRQVRHAQRKTRRVDYDRARANGCTWLGAHLHAYFNTRHVGWPWGRAR